MSIDVTDLRATIVPKSDQLNAEQLLAGPMTVTITAVRVSESAEQPVIVHYENDGGRPFKPCKTMRKVLLLAWGENGNAWAGKSMTLYNDPAVRFGGTDVGGIRISHMSDIPKDIKVSLTATKGKKALYEVKRMDAPVKVDHAAAIAGAATADALKKAFGAAWKSTADAAVQTRYKATYDARLAALTGKPPQAAA